MQETLLSVGIDLGTTTTQVIFSRIYLESAAVTAIPDIKITKKEILYRSPIYFTPVLPGGQDIDFAAVAGILQTEYQSAGVQKNAIATGAVIITGETARKENAEAVLHRLAEFAGDFVVATAGPDLESVLAGYGAGAAELSKQEAGSVVNFDIGGGTTNAALFINGAVQQTFALDIGGRLVRLDEQQYITYISERVQPFLAERNLPLFVGKKAEWNELCLLTDAFADTLLAVSKGEKLSPAAKELFIGPAAGELPRHKVMFSGGVAEFIYRNSTADRVEDIAIFGDIGPLLGQSIRRRFEAAGNIPLLSKEKIRATVIGAGSHSLHISGSTVTAASSALPLKNLPVLFLAAQTPAEMEQELKNKLILFPEELPAIAFRGSCAPSYMILRQMAAALASELREREEKTIVVLIEEDFAKALGLTLQRLLPDRSIICLDKIKAGDGDYVDIGRPVGGVVPVVVKTLIFNV
ncbi:MAG: Ethanolamine utilization EutA [Firmicutes bacterium]|nr:Ethanolamine utilization EutA [Bacillota bacterium]